ncbi:hypothetical protein [Caulobacter sp. LARHSG274]
MDYGFLNAPLQAVTAPGFDVFSRMTLPGLLADAWCADFYRSRPTAQIVSVQLDHFTYLFDLDSELTIAAYGLMNGRNRLPRDASRMAGHPHSAGPAYHRGHLIPHSGHGGTDINLFVQLGSVNIGPFRQLERLAVANPGAFYFVYLIYPPGPTDRPLRVEQGLFLAGGPPTFELRRFNN